MVAMIRPGAAFFAAPLFGMASVPAQLRLVIALAIGMAGLNAAPFTLPPEGIASFAGVALVIGEVLAGMALGFAVQIGFSAAALGGETISNTMGLGFASLVDPTSRAATPALGQFMQLLATFLFLSINGHLTLATIVVDSYRALPVGAAWLAPESVRGLLMFGGDMLAAGVAIALPVAFALVLVQIVMGMLARSAPAMNLFSVGLPATLLAGIILLAVAAPLMGEGIADAIARGLDTAHRIALGH
ncbi:flagellar biosynthetic protein FliR [Sphingomonas nostoxanthinifaciens]|uniref:flagellar biosynthetic protein FliR n=1 Tax=Sphingomonas nostoxanthinifaciens TaxID=2872652 RepID=UPI001CC1F92A|nr:flagellar biosynthetic protein FliR [Sphingomonas nostoxanthinifaciens]UAK26569.1 flagellar biosynthetic protein FliR [Sphingomonas nostoxanthinifaciens]